MFYERPEFKWQAPCPIADYYDVSIDLPQTFYRFGLSGMINLVFPMTFLFATVAGRCSGGTLRLFKLRRKKRAEWYWLIPEGVLVGLVVVAALSAGLGNATGILSPTVVGNEVGAFAIAALSGFLGTSALDYFYQESPQARILKLES